MKVVVFDLDQTLMNLLPIHRRSFANMFKKVYGVSARLEEIKYDGLTVHVCIKKVLALHNLPTSLVKKKMSWAIAELQRYTLFELKKVKCSYLLPGSKSLVKWLKEQGYVLCVLTGEPKKITLSALNRECLRHYFSIIVTAEGHNRIFLARKLLQKLKSKGKLSRLVFVGGSIHDVKAGKSVKAETLAVVTGLYSRKELEKYKPDLLVQKLTDKKIKLFLR